MSLTQSTGPPAGEANIKFDVLVEQAIKHVEEAASLHGAPETVIESAANAVAPGNHHLYERVRNALEDIQLEAVKKTPPVQKQLGSGRSLVDLADQVESQDRKLSVTFASDIVPIAVRWLWDDHAPRIPIGEITLTPGFAGVGKSTFHAWLLAQITRGTLHGIHYGTPRNVIVCAREDSWKATLVPRLITAGADLTRVIRVDVTTNGATTNRINLPEDIDGLRDLIIEHDVALVSLDPLLSAIDSSLDNYNSRDIRDALEPLRDMADTTRCVILGNAHFNKSSGSNDMLRVAGAAAFNEVCRAMISFAHDKETGENVISQAKNNLGRTDLPSLTYRIDSTIIEVSDGNTDVGKLVFTGESLRSVNDLLNPSSMSDGDRRKAAEVILTELATGPQTWRTLTKAIEAVDVSEHTGRRARKELQNTDKIGHIGGGGQPWIWHRIEEVAQGVGKWASSSKTDENEKDVAQPVGKQNVNGDAYLPNLPKEEEDIRATPESNLPTLLCGECGFADPQHAAVCPNLPDPF